MKLREIIALIDLAPKPYEDIDSEGIASEFNITLPYDVDLCKHGFLERHFVQWYCTDTWVGSSAIFLDGSAVAVTHQDARKSDKQYFFLGKEEAGLVRKRLGEVVAASECRGIQYTSAEEELGDGFHVQYGTQLLTKDVIWNGRAAKVVKTFGERYEPPVEDWHKVNIEVDGVVHERVPLEEITVPFTGLAIRYPFAA